MMLRGLLAAALVLAAFGAGWWSRPSAPVAPVIRHLTYTGNDREPAADRDGRLIAFTSDRDGTPRVWLKRVASGDETPLTAGPDQRPRLSPDGASILFARTEGLTTSLYRVPTLGGDARRLIVDAIAGDFAPDGGQVVFVRWRSDADGRMHSEVRLADGDGGNERLIVSLDDRQLDHPRWSPDASTVALVDTESAAPAILLVDLSDGAVRTVRPDDQAGALSAPAWASADTLIYAVSGSRIPRHGGASRVVRHDPDEPEPDATLFWQPSLVESVDRLGPDTLVFASRAPSMDLVETEVASGHVTGWRTRGSSTDRQPRYAPDGGHIVFSSNRSGNLDLWSVTVGSGSLRRLTDHPAEDWDPAFLGDGRLLWSSNRSGTYEIWLAERDGTAPRQITRDGELAENPTATTDSAWVIYNSRNADAPGIWKVRPDGRDASRLVAGVTRLPEVSPDGRHVLYLRDIRPGNLTLAVARVADGVELPHALTLPSAGGRARWLPDGSGIAYTAPEDDGRLGLRVIDFPLPAGGESTTRALTPPTPGVSVDSFALTPDGRRVCIAREQVTAELLVADGVAP